MEKIILKMLGAKIIAILIILVFVAFILLRVFFIKKSKKRRLVEAGLITQHSKIKQGQRSIFISEPAPQKSSEDFKKSLKLFEEIFETSLTGLEFITRGWFAKVFLFQKNGIKLIIDRTPRRATLKTIPHLDHDFIYLGEGGDGSIGTDLHKTHCGFISASPGQGKTNFFKLLSLGFLKNNPNSQVLILDAKSSFAHLKGNSNIFIYDMRDPQGIAGVCSHFQELRRQFIESEEILETQGLHPENMTEIRKKDPFLLPLKSTLIICDEAFFYTSLRKGESHYQLKKELIDSLEDFVRRGRSYGIHLFFGIQDAHADQFFLTRDYFNIRLYSKASVDMSRKLTGSDILTSSKLNERGVFYLDLIGGEDDGYSGFVRVPFVSNEVKSL